MTARDLPPAEIGISDPADAYAGQAALAPFIPSKHDHACRCGCQQMLSGPLLDAIRHRWEPQWIPGESRWQRARDDVQALLAEVERQTEALQSISRNFGCPECNSARTAQEALDG